MSEKCPPECKVRLRATDEKLKSHDKAILADYKHWEGEMNKRAKTTTLIAIAVVMVGVLSGLLSTLFLQANGIDRKVDLIRENQVQVMTVMGLKNIELKELERHRQGK